MHRLVDTCVAECDRRAVLGALMTHVAKIGRPDHKRPSKVRQLTQAWHDTVLVQDFAKGRFEYSGGSGFRRPLCTLDVFFVHKRQ